MIENESFRGRATRKGEFSGALPSWEEVKQQLLAGKCLLMLCDTIYGFIALAPPAGKDCGDERNEEDRGKLALQALKGRDEGKPFLQLYGSVEQLAASPWAQPPKELLSLWPGPLTCVLPLELESEEKKTLAVRIPKHKMLQNLALELDRGLYSSSANRSGRESLNSPSDLLEEFADEIASGLVLPYFPEGESCSEKPLASCLVDLTSTPYKILRRGSLELETLFPELPWLP